MRAGVIAPVVPPLPGGGRWAGSPGVVRLVRGPLPLPSLPPLRTSPTVVYGLAAVDDRGRVADRVVMRALGWPSGLRIDIRESDGVLTVLTAPDGAYQVTSHGYLRLPAALRHKCGLATGDRVLLAADPDRSCLAVYPPAVLDNALAQPADTSGGEPA